MIDSRDVKELHPALQRGAEELIRRLATKGLPVLITSTYRDNERQNALYAQGRTAPGKIVTNAKGGQSIHNYRLAFDICKNQKGAEYTDASFFDAAGHVWTELGGEWGGSWKSFPDRPHFQYTGGLTLAQLQKGQKLAENVKMPWEKAIQKEEPEMIDKTKIMLNGKEVEVMRIFKDGYNFIQLRELEKLGLKVGYDEARKIPTICS